MPPSTLREWRASSWVAASTLDPYLFLYYVAEVPLSPEGSGPGGDVRAAPVASKRKRSCEHAPVPHAWLDPKEWWRAGQGRTCDLLLPREEVVAVVRAVVEKADDHFDVIVCDRVQPPGERRFRSRHRVVTLDELLLADATNQFLRSKTLTPSLPNPRGDWDWTSACSLNGLVRFQRAHGSRPASMGIVPRVENKATEQRLEHVEYDRLFEAIKRRVRRACART